MAGGMGIRDKWGGDKGREGSEVCFGPKALRVNNRTQVLLSGHRTQDQS